MRIHTIMNLYIIESYDMDSGAYATGRPGWYPNRHFPLPHISYPFEFPLVHRPSFNLLKIEKV